MKRTLADRRRRPYRIAAAILLIGLGIAIGIYLKASSAPVEVPWEVTPESKTYLRNLQLYGGTANVLAVELTEWFKGLWHGKSLGLTVAVLAIILSGGYLFFATRLRSAPEEDDRQ